MGQRRQARLHHSLDEAHQRINWWGQQRERLDYDIDGTVLKVDNTRDWDRLGVVGREPRWATAYKFPPQQRTTKLRRIEVNVGRTGVLTPFAVLETVMVGGANVTMATLHNEGDIHRKDIRVGDTVIVQRAGEVIPQVVAPVLSLRDGRQVWQIPNAPFMRDGVSDPTSGGLCQTPAARRRSASWNAASRAMTSRLPFCSTPGWCAMPVKSTA
jgi:DNA ligase (NAD+)